MKDHAELEKLSKDESYDEAVVDFDDSMIVLPVNLQARVSIDRSPRADAANIIID